MGEVIGVTIFGAVGVGLGWLLSKIKNEAWALGFLVPLLFIVVIAMARRAPIISFNPLVALLMRGRVEYALMGFFLAVMFTTPALKLKRGFLQVFTFIFMAGVFWFYSVMPFLEPELIRDRLAAMKTRYDKDGVCMQNTEYTCGPASAVSGLRYLGFEAEEGEIAILAKTSSCAGTPPDMLCAALQNRYADEGLDCTYQVFKSFDQLKQAGVVLVEMKFGTFVGHWVAVLSAKDDEVIIADPCGGKRYAKPMEFIKKWRFNGVVLRKRPYYKSKKK